MTGDQVALLARGREVRRAARVPRDDLAEYIGVPDSLLAAWERRAPDLGRLSRRDRLALDRWAALLEQLDRDQAAR